TGDKKLELEIQEEISSFANFDRETLFNFASHTSMCTLWAGEELPKERADDLRSELAELLHVQYVLTSLRKPWMTGHTVGEQNGKFTNHHKFYSGLAALAKSKQDAIDRQEEEWEKEWKEMQRA